MSLKEHFHQLIDQLPDDCTTDDLYRLYVREKIREGTESVERDGTSSHEEVEKRFAKWLKPGSDKK